MNILLDKSYITLNRTFNKKCVPVCNRCSKRIIPKCTDTLVEYVGIISKIENVDVAMSTMTPEQCRIMKDVVDQVIFYNVKEGFLILLLIIWLLRTLNWKN